MNRRFCSRLAALVLIGCGGPTAAAPAPAATTETDTASPPVETISLEEANEALGREECQASIRHGHLRRFAGWDALIAELAPNDPRLARRRERPVRDTFLYPEHHPVGQPAGFHTLEDEIQGWNHLMLEEGEAGLLIWTEVLVYADGRCGSDEAGVREVRREGGGLRFDYGEGGSQMGNTCDCEDEYDDEAGDDDYEDDYEDDCQTYCYSGGGQEFHAIALPDADVVVVWDGGSYPSNDENSCVESEEQPVPGWPGELEVTANGNVLTIAGCGETVHVRLPD